MKKSPLTKSKEPLHLVGVKRLHLRGVKQTVIILGIILFLSPSYSADFTITLKQGKNLISIPLIPQNDQVPSVLQSITGLYTDVWGFDPLDTVDPWKHYRPDLTEYSDLNKIKHGIGYYLFATGDSNLTVTGAHPTANYTFTLNKGWNVIGWPYLYEEDIEFALTNNASPILQFGIDYNQISRINPVTKGQEDYYNNPSIDIFNTFTPGKAYYIYFLEENPVQVTLLLIPQVKITSHTDNSYVNTPLIDISGTIDDDTTNVTVNSIAATVTNGIFTAHNVPLAEGINIVTAEAQNTAGNTNQDTININLDSQSPTIQIISPFNGAVINTAPITVSGTVGGPCDVIVNDILATVDGGTFTAEGVNLRYGENTITATAYDASGNFSRDIIMVTSTTSSDYNIVKITPDIYEDDPTTIVAGSQVSLTVKLEIDGSPAANEPIEFHIAQGSGSMVQSVVNTNANGEATGVLNTDTNASNTNLVEVFDQNFTNKKVTFHIDTKVGSPAILTKLTNETPPPSPGATIPLIVKLTDINSNAIENEQINFAVSQGGGTLSASSAVTSYYGIATVNLTTPSSSGTLIQIIASSVTTPSATITFNITTSPTITVTLGDLFNKVNLNSQKIQDQITLISATSDDPNKPATANYRVWQKGDLMKTEDLSTSEISIRPQLTQTTIVPANTQIATYDPASNIYIVETKIEEQAGEKPYTLTYIDYGKGVITKMEFYYETEDLTTMFAVEMSDFIQIPEASNTWLYNVKREKVYTGIENTLLYTTTVTVTSRQVNVGLTNADFQ